jgi:hypothetical protein
MSEQLKLSPQITFFKWGKLDVAGYEKSFRDAKLYPGGTQKWDWKETGTKHEPGIQITDVDDILKQGATIIVLSKGVQLRLKTKPETLAYLSDKGIIVHHLQTEEAIEKYNELAQAGEAVGALIHSTC